MPVCIWPLVWFCDSYWSNLFIVHVCAWIFVIIACCKPQPVAPAAKGPETQVLGDGSGHICASILGTISKRNRVNKWKPSVSSSLEGSQPNLRLIRTGSDFSVKLKHCSLYFNHCVKGFRHSGWPTPFLKCIFKESLSGIDSYLLPCDQSSNYQVML